MRKELSPFSCRNHVVNYLSAELFVFGDRVGFIHNTMLCFLFETRAKKGVLHTFITIETIPEIRHILPTFRTKTDIICKMTDSHRLKTV